MSQSSRQNGKKSEQSQFSLKPLEPNLFYKKKIQFSFQYNSKKTGKKRISKAETQSCRIYPVFNKDKNHATPTFILASQKEYFEKNRKYFMLEHVRKVKQYEQTPQELYFPVPRSSYDYCNVCCKYYTNYIEHINSYDHRYQIKLSKTNEYILDIEKQFQLENEKNTAKRFFDDRVIDIDQDSDCEWTWGKKIKRDETFIPPNTFYEHYYPSIMPQVEQYYNYYNLQDHVYQFPLQNSPKLQKTNPSQQTIYPSQYGNNPFHSCAFGNQMVRNLNEKQPQFVNRQNNGQVQQQNILINQYYQNHSPNLSNGQVSKAFHNYFAPYYQTPLIHFPFYYLNIYNQPIFSWCT